MAHTCSNCGAPVDRFRAVVFESEYCYQCAPIAAATGGVDAHA